ncbi:MAG: EscU/YscU/HrcU family type III secretion system export apparatus switch protein [Myxococcaceae bacterium]
MSEKTEQPTDKKLREARKQGQIARSRLLSAAAASFGGLLGLLAFRDANVARLKTWTVKLFTTPDLSPAVAMREAVSLLAVSVAPVLAGAFLGALLASIAMAGFQFEPSSVAPKLDRLDPAQGIKKVFNLGQLFEVSKGLVVAMVIALIVWGAVSDDASAAFNAIQLQGGAPFAVLIGLLLPVVVKGLAVLLVLGGVDYGIARWRHRRQLMMTKEEVKQEHKQSEGDPHHKAKRKAVHRQLIAGGPARGVHKASAVVVNPTHIAVALRYDEAECEAPYIVAKGQEDDAMSLRKEAEKLQIPVVRDIPLARSLIPYDVGEAIPEELYQAAAAILKVALEKSDRPEGETK